MEKRSRDSVTRFTGWPIRWLEYKNCRFEKCLHHPVESSCNPPDLSPSYQPSWMVSFTQKLGWKWTSNGDFGFFLFFTPF